MDWAVDLPEQGQLTNNYITGLQPLFPGQPLTTYLQLLGEEWGFKSLFLMTTNF